MRLLSKTNLTLAATALMATTAVSAASFDMRHEYKHSSDQHATRVKMGDSIDNFYYSGELKFKGKDGEFLKDLQNNGWELDLGYRHKINDNWTLQPGMPIEARTSGITFKPQLRLTYALDSIEGLSLSGRYRYDIKQYSDGTSTQNRHRLTGNINYKFDEWSLGLEGNYYKADGYDLYEDTDTNVEFNSTIRRSFGQWAPYAEFGYASYSKDGGYGPQETNNAFELRSRVGLTYSF